MNMANKTVIHKSLGEGSVVAHVGEYITILFEQGEKKFIYPDSFKAFLKAKDEDVQAQIQRELVLAEKQRAIIQQERERTALLEKERESTKRPPQTRTKTSTYPRANIAFKCNYCDGGQSDSQIGFDGVCSDKLIHNNIQIERRAWCSADGCACYRYYNKRLSRNELDSMCDGDGFVCYESQMLRDWKAMAGIVQNGENKGKPMKLNRVKANSLCVLSTRDPQSSEDERYIFAVFLVDETYEGDGHEEGYVTTKSVYKLKLSPNEARAMFFWNYHANSNNPDIPAWNTGLHRYFDDDQAARMLKDIAELKEGTAQEELSKDFLAHFCTINGVDVANIPPRSGALVK